MGDKSADSLYVGLDDSNHYGTRKGEVIVAVFSEIYQDQLIKNFPRERKSHELLEIEYWLKNNKRDYRFTILTHRELSKGSYNLQVVAPYLIEDYLSGKSNIRNIRLSFDGRLKKDWREILEEDLNQFEELEIKNFTGPTKTHTPTVLGIADRLSNFIFRGHFGSLDDLLKSSKMVPIDNETFSERIKLFKN